MRIYRNYATILFDKMQAARRLETEGKFTRAQAETLAEVYHDAMTEAVATKADLEALEAKLTARIAGVEHGSPKAERGC